MKRFFKWLLLLVLIGVAVFILWPEKRYKAYQVDADYLSQTESYNIPDMPPDWTWQYFEAKDGTNLRWGETGNRDAAKASIIFVPGYTATMDMYGEHVDQLARRGFHVMGIDMRGQGGSDRHRSSFPEKLWVKDFGVYSADLVSWLDSLGLPDTRPVLLAGSSFGGHVVTRTLAEHPDLPVNAVYLIAPALRPKAGDYNLEQIKRASKFSILMGKSHQYVPGQTDWRPEHDDLKAISRCSSEPKRVHYRDVIFTRKPEQRVGGVTYKWFYEFILSSDKINNEKVLSRIDWPITIITAENDDFVENADNAKACKSYFSNCREVFIPGAGHCLLQETDFVFETMIEEFDRLYERTISGPF